MNNGMTNSTTSITSSSNPTLSPSIINSTATQRRRGRSTTPKPMGGK
ncbi:1628_t:CDS:2 [Diversispora eburnea]|uniref:1628_t:CDS:1 n=1 Tax=Diversispora eburnea TaxID=1213867 RepID=A0A9N9BRA1_9GLOM|nr:1628_t:CDS:2 [Diversispora eburnea]